MWGNRRRDPRRRTLRRGRKPGADPMILVLGAAMLVLYGVILWLWITPDETVAGWLTR